MKKPSVAIIIPIYNESKSLPELIHKLSRALNPKFFTVTLYAVDDGSTDQSFDTLLRLKQTTLIPMQVYRFRKNIGKSAALALAFDRVIEDIVVTIDADLQDDPNNISAMIKKLDEGFDMVVGWRKTRHDPWQKRLLSRIFNTTVSLVSGISIHDFNIGLKCYRKKVVKEIHIYGELHRFTPLLAFNRGFRIGEIPVTHHPRKHGVSKFGSSRILSGSLDLITTLFLLTCKQQPMKLFGGVGLLSVAISLCILGYLLLLRFQGAHIGTRPMLFFGIMVFIFGIQVIFTGLLAELLITNRQHVNDYPLDEKAL